MDSKKNIASLKKDVQRFCEVRDWDQYHGAKDLAIGIITEASELLEHFRFKDEKAVERIFRDVKKKREISHEMADIFYFLLRLTQRYDIDLSAALAEKMELNEKRYPVHKSKGSNKKYSELK